MFLTDEFAWGLSADNVLAVSDDLTWIIDEVNHPIWYSGDTLQVDFTDGHYVRVPIGCKLLSSSGQWVEATSYLANPSWLAYLVPETRLDNSWLSGQASVLYSLFGWLEVSPILKLGLNRQDIDHLKPWLRSNNFSVEMVGFDAMRFLLATRPKSLIEHLLTMLPGTTAVIYKFRVPSSVSVVNLTNVVMPSRYFLVDGVAVCH